MKWLILIVGIASNAVASLLIKKAVMPPQKALSLSEPLSLLANGPLWLGLIFYGTAFLLYAISLTHFPLHIAHPALTSGTIASVALCSIWLFQEPFYWTTALGILCIICGIILMMARAF